MAMRKSRPARCSTLRRASIGTCLAIALALISLVCISCGRRVGGDRPNIVLIIGDDVGWSDFGFMGARDIHTPALDRLADEGTVFTHAMSSASACKPALRTLLTGLSPSEVSRRLLTAGRRSTVLPELREVFETLPERLAEQGYASFQAGKFWEGSFEMGGFTHGMTWRFGNALEQFEGYHRHSGADGLAIGRETMEPLFDFLDDVGEQPFFVWYAPLLPHLPHDAPDEFTALYADAPDPAWLRAYRANVTWFDATVGALVDKLDALGVRDDTLILYLSDNGWDSSRVDGDRGKASLFEMGYRTPLVVVHPPSIAAGRRDGRLVMFADVFATLLDAAGAAPVVESTGESLIPLLRGEGDFYRPHVIGGSGPRDAGLWFVRTPTWRYQRRGGRESLYRIEDDPLEEHDLAARHPDVVAKLGRELGNHLERVR